MYGALEIVLKRKMFWLYSGSIEQFPNEQFTGCSFSFRVKTEEEEISILVKYIKTHLLFRLVFEKCVVFQKVTHDSNVSHRFE